VRGFPARGCGAQAVAIEMSGLLEAFRKPHHQGHPFLFRRRDGIGQAEIQMFLPEGLSVIRNVNQAGVVRSAALQQVDRASEDMIGIEDRVVIGIDQRLVRTTGKVGGVAGRAPFAVIREVTLVVAGPWLPSMCRTITMSPREASIFSCKPSSRISSKHRPASHNAASADTGIFSTVRPSHTPLQPDWLSRQRTAVPARSSTCSRDSR